METKRPRKKGSGYFRRPEIKEAKAVLQKYSMEKEKGLFVRLPESLYEAFKIYCIKKDETIKEVMVKYINRIVIRKGIKDDIKE